MPKDEARSERLKYFASKYAHHYQDEDSARARRMALEMWDAAIDTAAKVAKDCPIDHLSHHGSMRKMIAAEIIALKGDRNVEQSGTE